VIIRCPDCGTAIGVIDRTQSVICRCRRYIKREEFEDAYALDFDPEALLPTIIIKRDDRLMREMRKARHNIDVGAQAQLDRVRERKQGG